VAGIGGYSDLAGLDVTDKPSQAAAVFKREMLGAAVDLVQIGINPGGGVVLISA